MPGHAPCRFSLQAIAKRNAADLAAAFTSKDIPFSPIMRPVEMYDDRHVNRPGGLVTTYRADGNTYRAPGLPFEVDGAPVKMENRLQEAGEDTEAVLGSLRK